MPKQCPLLFRQVDATVIRINTLFVMAGVVIYVSSGFVAIILAVIADFLLRLSGKKNLSPTQTASAWIQKKFSLPSKMEDAGAKRLAAFFGVVFMGAIVLFHWLEIGWAIHGVAIVYLLCASLELLFGYCIACKLYYLGQKIYPGRNG